MGISDTDSSKNDMPIKKKFNIFKFLFVPVQITTHKISGNFQSNAELFLKVLIISRIVSKIKKQIKATFVLLGDTNKIFLTLNL